jgi:hypothetical protein
MNRFARVSILAILFALAALLASPAFARPPQEGHSGGAGGNGVYAPTGGAVYLFDLVEAGVEEKPVFGCGEDCVRDSVLLRLNRVLGAGNTPEAVRMVAMKLGEIERVDRLTAGVLLSAIEMYGWRWVNLSLEPVYDSDGSDIEIDPTSLVQLAVRDEKVIRIDAALWKRLPDAHKAALLFHEVVYALVGSGSRGARDIVGYLFTRDLARGHAYFGQAVGAFLPVGEATLPSQFLVEKPAEGKVSLFDNVSVKLDTQLVARLTWDTRRPEVEASVERFCAKATGLRIDQFFRARELKYKLRFGKDTRPDGSTYTFVQAVREYDQESIYSYYAFSAADCASSAMENIRLQYRDLTGLELN